MVTMKAKQMVSKFDLDVLKQPLTFNIIITIIPVGRVMYIYTALTGVDRWIGNWEDWTSCALAHWMLPVSQQKAVCGKFPAHLMMRSDGRTADSGDLFVSMNGLVVYLMFLFCVVWLTKDFTLSQENVKLCLKHYPWSKKYIPRCLMQKKKKAGFADRLISSMTWEQAKNLKTEDWTGGA